MPDRQRAIDNLVKATLLRWIALLACVGAAVATLSWLLPPPGADPAADVLAAIASYLFLTVAGLFLLTMSIIAAVMVLPGLRKLIRRRQTDRHHADQ